MKSSAICFFESFTVNLGRVVCHHLDFHHSASFLHHPRQIVSRRLRIHYSLLSCFLARCEIPARDISATLALSIIVTLFSEEK
ncbi:hypothetical protein Bca4012_066540 [Brassica carinata]|uniref:Uncharacterized protein n=1 Tax=Brassica carinata TaxID=52824 RepID=A0A8X7VQX1_BRACI|nr:hypothetical protein Bca52824_018862 [Brassica carinata]